MSADKTIAALFNLPPKEAADYLQGRNKLTPTFSYQDLWHEEHTTQFTVSRLAKLDIMQSMYDGIVKSVEGDLSRRDWMRNSRELLQKNGWWGKKTITDSTTGELVTTTFNASRLDLIYDTNTRIAYSAGAWERMLRNKDSHPYIRYISLHDRRVRPQHLAWDNVTLPIEDSFWDTHYPPNGYRCRCRAMSISQAEYDSGKAPNGAPLKKERPPITYKIWINKRTGVIERVPVGIDPGFAYNPGKVAMREKSLATISRTKLNSLPAPIRNAALSPVVVGDIDASFKTAIEHAIQQIPESIRADVFSVGYEVQIAAMVANIKPSIRHERPPGYPVGYTWEHSDGGRLLPEKIIAVGQSCIDKTTGKLFSINLKRSADVLRHEFGHAVDDVYHVSSSTQFSEAYGRDLKSIDISSFPESLHGHIDYMLQREGQGGRRETFADIFAELNGGGSSNISAVKLFPQTALLIKDVLNKRSMK